MSVIDTMNTIEQPAKKANKTSKLLGTASLILATIGLMACQNMPPSTTSPTTSEANNRVALSLTNNTLQRYNWQLASVTNSSDTALQAKLLSQDKPLILNFSNDGNVRLINTCNKMWGSYTITNGQVMVGDIASTRMLCEPDRMAFDLSAPTTLQGQFKLSQDAKGTPVLTVTAPNQISVFHAVAK